MKDKQKQLEVMKQILLYAVGGVLAFMVSGCMGAAAWDRDLLAQRPMSLNAYPNLAAFHDHIYFSKEGSSGGRTTDGGGCGCN